MTEGTASTFLPDPNKPPDISKPMFTFERTDWMDPPVFKPTDPTLSDSIYRRRANDSLYQQISSPAKWQKYVTLGYFAIDDGAFFDLEWSARAASPTKMHSIIWYNYLYHIDRDMDIPAKLNSWATQVSQPYLINNAPQILTIDTLTTSWKQTQLTPTPMDIEEDKWTEVISVGKAKATKRRVSSLTSKAAQSNLPTNIAPGFNLPENDTPRTSSKPTPVDNNENNGIADANTTPIANNEFSIWLNNRTTTGNPPTWAAPNNTTEQNSNTIPQRNAGTPPATSATNKSSSPSYTPHPNKKINDGTHRITIKWKLEKHYLIRLEENEDELLHEIHQLITHVFEDDDGLLYPWKSKDTQHTTPASKLHLNEVKQLISPNIAFIKSTSLLIFGIRFGFNANPSIWKFKKNTQTCMQSHHFNASISNSTCDSGNMVTAGYILLKAPNTTNTLFYLQHLTNKLPDNTPFFDILRFRKTPMDQDINHLVVQCGESHTIPLCQALSQYLTGNQTALFIPRYVLGSIPDEQIIQQFEVHEKYTKSLRALSLFPHVSNLDRVRTETLPDGTTIERSTREWASTLKAPDNSPALCDVVNGGPDQRANLLVPSPYYDHIKIQYKNYKTSLNPTHQREARYRASITDLPEVIHITETVQSNLDFLSNLATANAWQQTTASNPNTSDSQLQTTRDDNDISSPHWPTLQKTRQHQTTQRSDRQHPNKNTTYASSSNFSNVSEDQSTGSTQSLTRASLATSNQAQLQELAATLRKQQQAIDSSAQINADKLSTLAKQFKRFDAMDTKLNSMGTQLDQVTLCHETQSSLLKSIQTDTKEQFNEMGASLVNSITSQSNMANSMIEMENRMDKITDFMEKLTSRLDLALTQQTATIHGSRPDPLSASSQTDPNSDMQSQQLVTTEQTQTSQSSSSGSYTDPCYSSPQKKKMRSPDADNTPASQEMQLCLSYSDDEDNSTITTTTSNKSKACEKLNKRLFSQKDSQKSLAAIFNKATKSGNAQNTNAPPTTQYNSNSGSDGAAPL